MSDTEPSSQDGLRATTLRGRPIMVADDKPTFWDKAAAGLWERELLASFESVIVPGDAVLDVGAWVGPTTLFAAALGASVVSVEADPRAADLLSANIDANPLLSPRIRLVRRAAAAQAGRVTLGSRRKPGDSMSSVLLADRPGHWTVETATPADLVATLAPAPDAGIVVKVDIEGGEYELLPALAAALPASRTKLLLVAFHPALLRAAGHEAENILSATATCFAALDGWSSTVLEAGHPADARVAACTANVTIAFTKAS